MLTVILDEASLRKLRFSKDRVAARFPVLKKPTEVVSLVEWEEGHAREKAALSLHPHLYPWPWRRWLSIRWGAKKDGAQYRAKKSAEQLRPTQE
jgi:hypothetical protein